MKNILMLIFITGVLQANIEIKQNIKALYHNVKITENEKDYILDNKDENIKRIEKSTKNTNKKFKNKIISQKNVIEFTLHKNGSKSDYKYLSRGDTRKIDKETKKIIENTSFIKPEQNTKMRYIFIYEFGENKIVNTGTSSNYTQKSSLSTPEYKYIGRGTTSFEYSSKEYVRVFETSMDGFVNIKNTMCANMQLLTFKNQRVSTGYSPWYLNGAVKKGKYKLLVRTKKDCDVYIQYP